MESEKEIYANMKKNSIGGNKKEKLKLNIKRISAALAESLVVDTASNVIEGIGNFFASTGSAIADRWSSMYPSIGGLLGW